MAGPFYVSPPVVGAKTLARKFGQGVKAARDTASSIGQAVGDVGEAFLQGAELDSPTLADKIGTSVPKPVAQLSSPGQAAKPADSGGAAKTLAAKIATEAQARAGTGAQPSTMRGAYQDSPGFGNFGSTQPRSLAQMLSDEQASRLLDETYGARMASNEAMAPDYQGDALKARLRDAEYEANSQAPRPLYSTGDTLGSFYKEKNGTFTNMPAGPTLKQQFQMQQDRLKNADKVLDVGRGRIAEELETLKGQLDKEVAAGHRTRADADALYAKSVTKAQELAGIMKSGFPPTGY